VFPLQLIRFTARRKAGAELPVLYPRLLRDRSQLPKIGIAAQYFETMVGHERRELDPEVLVRFFGDHKVARCMVACLARTYRFRPPSLERIVGKSALRRLQRAGLASPMALRLHLYDEVNAGADGFLGNEQRGPALAKLEEERQEADHRPRAECLQRVRAE